MNIHSPERQAHETQEQYRTRQAASRAIVKVMTKGPTQDRFVPIPGRPGPNWVLWWTGQHTATAGKRVWRSTFKRLGRRQALKHIKSVRAQVL